MATKTLLLKEKRPQVKVAVKVKVFKVAVKDSGAISCMKLTQEGSCNCGFRMVPNFLDT